MANLIAPIVDTDLANIKSQLEYAKALRGQSLDTKGENVSGIYVPKSPWLNFVQGLTGSGVESYQRGQQRGIEQQQQTERNNWLGQMPSATETVPQAGPTEDGGFLPDVERNKSPRVLAKAMREWSINAPRGMEGVQNFAIQQALTAPEKEAEAAQKAADRAHEIQMKAAEAKQLQQERLEAQARADEQFKRTAAQQEKYLYAALAANRGGSQSPHTQIAYGQDGKGYMVDMRTGAQTPLENIGKMPAVGGAGGKLPVQAQKVQGSLQNLESGLNAYETLLKDYNPQNADALTPAKRAAIGTAFTDLQMRLKEAYELGAITGPDMSVLQSAITDPTSAWGMLKGGIAGRDTFNAQIGQSKAALNRQKRNFEQQFGVMLPTPAGTATEPMPGAAPVPAAPYKDPAKEARYQEWLRSQPK